MGPLRPTSLQHQSPRAEGHLAPGQLQSEQCQVPQGQARGKYSSSAGVSASQELVLAWGSLEGHPNRVLCLWSTLTLVQPCDY